MILTAVLTIALLALLFGSLLGYAAIRFHVEGDPLADQIDRLLPQTQCGQCGHPGCRPYAEAVAQGKDDIDKCVPGGAATVQALADLLGRTPATREFAEKIPMVARIDDQTCIGCTLCLQACPVDAIVGAARQLHGVISADCTGCERCVPPCPVDAVRMVPVERDARQWRWPWPGDPPRPPAH